MQPVANAGKHATRGERGKTYTVTSDERGKTCKQLRTRENMQPVANAGKTMQQVTNAGKHVTSGERGKTYNWWQSRKKC